jgi:hypothetical protein
MSLDPDFASRYRAHEDKATIVFKMLPCCLANEELRSRIQAEDMVEQFLSDVFGVVKGLSPAVAHDNIDFPKVLFAFLEQALNLRNLSWCLACSRTK